MTWEEKTEMVTLLNKGEYSKATKLIFDAKDTIDDQAVDMFLTGFELVVENIIAKEIAMHEVLNTKFNAMQTGSIRTAMRMALYEELIKQVST